MDGILLYVSKEDEKERKKHHQWIDGQIKNCIHEIHIELFEFKQFLTHSL